MGGTCSRCDRRIAGSAKTSTAAWDIRGRRVKLMASPCYPGPTFALRRLQFMAMMGPECGSRRKAPLVIDDGHPEDARGEGLLGSVGRVLQHIHHDAVTRWVHVVDHEVLVAV